MKRLSKKIRDIQKYKKHFYQYFKREETSIYSEVTFLEHEAVTHLVISSLYNKVEPHKEWFPFVGEFPYLGFFNKQSALDYAENMREDEYFTFIRPVYAYSTLGNFEDKILSSFFYYDEKGLAELIFHELVHTIFFVKDDVDFNENVANYIGKEMMYEFFGMSHQARLKNIQEAKKKRELKDTLVSLIKKYKTILKHSKVQNKSEVQPILKKFLEETFYPKIAERCKTLEFSKEYCQNYQGKWNNARFAAYMTYEKKINFIEELRQKYKFSLIELLNYLEKEYTIYRDSDSDAKFSKWLEEKQ